MNVRVLISIAVLVALSSCLLATQYASAQESALTPRAALQELAVQADYSRSDYRAHCLTPRRLHIRILDPLLGAALALETERADRGSSWCVDRQSGRRDLPSTVEPVVTIQITPNWSIPLFAYATAPVFGPFLWALGDTLSDAAAPTTSFTRVELVRDEIVVHPISTRRDRAGNLFYTNRDSYFGSFEYPPEAFTPGAEVVLRVWRDDDEKPHTMRLRERLLSRISRNFELYYEAMPSQSTRIKQKIGEGGP